MPETGEYELWVYRNNQFAPDADYGLAWWYGLAPPIEPPDVTGDFDVDGDVDGRDFLVWQRGNSPNPLSASDLADWQANYGTGSLAATTAVPEPGSFVFLACLVALAARPRFWGCIPTRFVAA